MAGGGGGGLDICLIILSAQEFQWKKMSKFTFLKQGGNEAVYQSSDIVKPFGRSSGGRIVTVIGVIFPCFFITELSSCACSYLVIHHWI